MNYHKGSAPVPAIIILLGIIILGALGFMAIQNSETAPTAENLKDDSVQTAPENEAGASNEKISIAWRFTEAGEVDHIPYTSVAVIINGMTQEMGKFQGSCAEIGASGGVDGKGLLAGELSAAQCWFAGGGDEIGVFAHEDGGVDIMVGTLEEPIEGSAGFRGDFKVKNTFKF